MAALDVSSVFFVEYASETVEIAVSGALILLLPRYGVDQGK